MVTTSAENLEAVEKRGIENLVWCPRNYWHKSGSAQSRFFTHHLQTYPKELNLSLGPWCVLGAPFAQNDTTNFYCELQGQDTRD